MINRGGDSTAAPKNAASQLWQNQRRQGTATSPIWHTFLSFIYFFKSYFVAVDNICCCWQNQTLSAELHKMCVLLPKSYKLLMCVLFAQIVKVDDVSPLRICWMPFLVHLKVALGDTALFKKMNILFEWIFWILKKMNILFEWIFWILKKWIFCLNEYSGF